MLAAADSAIFLAQMGSDLREELGGGVAGSKWYGSGTLGGFLRSMDPPLGVNDLHVWDPDRHATPALSSRAGEQADLPPLVMHVCQVTDFPKLASPVWPNVFDALAEYARSHAFNLTEITAWTRDRLAEEPVPVGRTPIGFVVRAAVWAGVGFQSETPPTADEIRRGVLTITVDRAQSAGLSLTDHEVAQFEAWLCGDGDQVGPPTA